MLTEAKIKNESTQEIVKKIFKDEKLITKLGCQMNPIEVVPKVLSQSTIVNISELLMKKAGWNEKFTVEEVVEEIKN